MKMLFAVAIAVVVFLVAGGVAGAAQVVITQRSGPVVISLGEGDGKYSEYLVMFLYDQVVCYRDNGNDYVGRVVKADDPATGDELRRAVRLEHPDASAVWINQAVPRAFCLGPGGKRIAEVDVSPYEYRLCWFEADKGVVTTDWAGSLDSHVKLLAQFAPEKGARLMVRLVGGIGHHDVVVVDAEGGSATYHAYEDMPPQSAARWDSELPDGFVVWNNYFTGCF